MMFKKKKIPSSAPSAEASSATKADLPAKITSESDKKKKKILNKRRKAYEKLASEATEYEIASEKILLDTYSEGGAVDRYLDEQLQSYNPDSKPLTKEEAESIIYGLIDLLCAERTRYSGDFIKICKEGSEADGYRKRIEEIGTLERETENAKSAKNKLADELEKFTKEFEEFNRVEQEIRKADLQEKYAARLRRAEKRADKEKRRQLRKELRQEKAEAKIALKKARIQKKIDKLSTHNGNPKGKSPPDKKRDPD